MTFIALVARNSKRNLAGIRTGGWNRRNGGTVCFLWGRQNEPPEVQVPLSAPNVKGLTRCCLDLMVAPDRSVFSKSLSENKALLLWDNGLMA
jgi:hypothetical protein